MLSVDSGSVFQETYLGRFNGILLAKTRIATVLSQDGGCCYLGYEKTCSSRLTNGRIIRRKTIFYVSSGRLDQAGVYLGLLVMFEEERTMFFISDVDIVASAFNFLAHKTQCFLTHSKRIGLYSLCQL